MVTAVDGGRLDTERFHRWHRSEPHTCGWFDAVPRCDPMRLLHWVHDRIGVPIPTAENGCREYVTDLWLGDDYLTVDTLDADQLTPEGDDVVRHSYEIPGEKPPFWPPPEIT